MRVKAYFAKQCFALANHDYVERNILVSAVHMY